MKAKLVEKRRLTSSAAYLALSHCWGTRKFITLTTSEYETYLENIPLYSIDFNPLFRDAMQVTMDLGYNHIWIDSLCIIQDTPDASDWAHECPFVGEYYFNADITLSATGFPDGQSGLFRSRDPREHGWASVEFKDYGRYLLKKGIPNVDLEDSPLGRRGWALQERLFVSFDSRMNVIGLTMSSQSTRTLHFTEDMIIWECCANTLCDYWPGELWRAAFGWNMVIKDRLRRVLQDPEGALDRQSKPVGTARKFMLALMRAARKKTDHPTMENDAKINSSTAKRNEATDFWYHDIVESLSRTQITYSEDKLPTISGLARFYEQVINSRYLAGHWEHSLLQSLDWLVDVNQTKVPTREREPSWSWSSVELRVSFGVPSFTPQPCFSEIIESSVSLATSDPWGEVSSGQLRIRGPLQRLDLFEHKLGTSKTHFRGDKYYALVLANKYQTEFTWNSPIRILALGDDPDPDTRSSEEPPGLTSLYILPLRAAFDDIAGLILQRNDPSGNVYVRVGCFRMSRFTETPVRLGQSTPKALEQDRVYDIFRLLETEEIVIV